MADPNFASVGLLLHCNGSDGSTSFPDSSNSAHTVTAVGNAQVDTGQSKWGGASAQFDGTGDKLTVPWASSLDLATGDFTVEGWVRFLYNAESWSTSWLISQPGNSSFDQWALFAQSPGGDYYELGFSAVNTSNSQVIALVHGTPLYEGVWYHVAVTRSGSTFRLFVNGASPVSGTSSATLKSTSAALHVGDAASGSAGHCGWLDDIRITKGVARYTAAFTPPAAEFEEGEAGEYAWVDAPSPLGEPAALAAVQVDVYGAADSMLGTVAVLGTYAEAARIDAPSPLGGIELIVFTDWTGQVAPLQPMQFALDLVTPAGDVRVPMSSWQATLTTAGECYAGCVIPAALDWLSVLEVATEFVISRRVALAGGAVIFDPLIRCPMQTLQIDQGPVNGTASLSGYFDEIPASDDPPSMYDRTLSGVRSLSTYVSGRRLRCEIDWLLRPGQRAFYGAGQSLRVDYMNLYATIEGTTLQAYMDVGERV